MGEKIIPIYIEFKDHVSESSWIPHRELCDFKPEVVYQLGWLVGEDNDCYKVSGQVCSDGSSGDTIVILKSTVISIKKFKVKFPKEKKDA